MKNKNLHKKFERHLWDGYSTTGLPKVIAALRSIFPAHRIYYSLKTFVGIKHEK